MRLLIVGEQPSRSAPSLTLTRNLERHGIRCRFSRGSLHRSTAKWLRMVRWANGIVYQGYHGDIFSLRQLAIAAAMGRPILRRWAGTDVLVCLDNTRTRKVAKQLDRIVSLNFTPAEHLASELASIGITARVIPPMLDNLPPHHRQPQIRNTKSLLVYLPSARHDFYGLSAVKLAANANPDIEFVVVADDTHTLGKFSNVTSLGWVQNMESVWQQVGGLLRITKHDGMPRMVLECLARGKYAIYSWPLEGCWFARTNDEIQNQIDRFRQAAAFNKDGVEVAKRLLRPDASNEVAELIRATVRNRCRSLLLRSIPLLTSATFQIKFQKHVS